MGALRNPARGQCIDKMVSHSFLEESDQEVTLCGVEFAGPASGGQGWCLLLSWTRW